MIAPAGIVVARSEQEKRAAVARSTPSSVNKYIASQPEVSRNTLEQVREVIRCSMPDAEETISYGMPAYKLHGRTILFFAGWKEHFSLYPGNNRLVAAFAGELKNYKVSKGTIQVPLGEPVPVRLIERIAKFRAEEAAAEAQSKAVRVRKPGRVSQAR